MFGIGNIKVNAKGKTPEQIKEEILAEVGKQVDQMISVSDKAHKKEEVKPESKEPVFLHLRADEAEDKSGFGVSTEWNGDFATIMTMLTTSVSQALHTMANDADDEYNPDLLLRFIGALIHEYTYNDEEEDK